MKILLVDDQKMNLLLHARMLKDLDVEVLQTTRAEEAITLAEAHDLALVLLDVQMPGMDGFEVARRLQVGDGHQEVPIIFITGSRTGSGQVFEGYATGAVDFLIKPVEPNVLLGKAKFFCELKRRELVIRSQTQEIMQKNEALRRDAKERQELEEARQESEVRYRTFVELCPDPIAVQAHGHMVYFNTSLMRLLGTVDRDLLAGRSIESFAADGSVEILAEHLEVVRRQGGVWDPVEVSMVCLDGTKVDVEVRCGCILIEGDTGVQVALQDVTERKRMEEKLRRQAVQDGLTGVANRRCFDEVLAREWRRALRYGSELAVIMIDIDHFKHFNDTHGHLAGDDCLRAVAKTINGALHRGGDTVARYGGEEFAAILPGTDVEGARVVAERMRGEVMNTRVAAGGNGSTESVTISLGLSVARPSEDREPGSLVAAADRALYAAKENGRNRVCIDPAGEWAAVSHLEGSDSTD